MNLDIYQLINLSSDESTPPHVLNELSKRTEELILEGVASNSSTPVDTLIELYRTYPSLASALAGNKSCPGQVLLEIAKSATSMIAIENICSNPSATDELLLKLANSRITRVQELIAKNAVLTDEIIDVLMRSQSDLVISSLASNKGLRDKDFAHICEVGNLDAINAIASNESCPHEILYRLHALDIVQANLGLSCNKNAPIDILEHLSFSKNETVRFRVASNTSANRDILLRLIVDEKVSVRGEAYENPTFVSCLSDYEIRNLFSGRLLARELLSNNTALRVDFLFDRLADERGQHALDNVIENLKYRGRDYWGSLPIELIDPQRLCGSKRIPLHLLLTKFGLSEVQEVITSIALKIKVDEQPMTSIERLRIHL
jgi:hypothetical protein